MTSNHNTHLECFFIRRPKLHVGNGDVLHDLRQSFLRPEEIFVHSLAHYQCQELDARSRQSVMVLARRNLLSIIIG